MSKSGMKVRASVAFAATALLAAVLVPSVGAQKVETPGAFSIIPTSGSISLGSTSFDLTPRPLPECSDGVDNESVKDGRIDVADFQCVAGPNGEPASLDDSETAAGFQPKVETQLNGTIDADGNVSIPTSGVVFPPVYLYVDAGVGTGVVTANIVATHPAEGTLDPLTGAADLRVRLKVNLRGSIAGLSLGSECSIGTNGNPIDISFTTGASTNGSGATLYGSPYVPAGNLTVVNNTFAVPGANRCGDAPFYGLTGIVSGQVGLPSAAGKNTAILSGAVDPAPQAAIRVVASASPSSGAAPLEVDFDATDSVVTNGPATYSWVFPDGSQKSGPQVSHTFTTQGTKAVDLTVSDADGDSVRRRLIVLVSGGTTTTTTTTSTTTTQPTTTTTQPTTTTTSTTTTQPTTTSTTTTTTQPTTTSTTTTTTQPTTTTTTQPSGGDADSVSVDIGGVTDYAAAGELDSGDYTVGRRGGRIAYVRGAGSIEGPAGASARVAFRLDRVLFFDLWVGEVSVTDTASGVRSKSLFVGSPRISTAADGAVTVSGRSVALESLPAPSFLGVSNVDWSLTDAV